MKNNFERLIIKLRYLRLQLHALYFAKNVYVLIDTSSIMFYYV